MSIVQSSLETRSKIKIVMLGDQGVGKTSLIQKFIHDKFHEIGYPTVGIDFLAKDYTYQQKHVRLQLWDTAGQERFRSLIPSYLKDSQCAIIVFDLCNRSSFQNVQSWLNLYKQNRTQFPIAVLAGNKSDLAERVCQFEEVDSRAKHLGVKYVQISAKTGQNINILFQTCLQQIFKYVLVGSKISSQKEKPVFQATPSAQILQPQPIQPFALRNDILNVQNQQQQSQCRC